MNIQQRIKNAVKAFTTDMWQDEISGQGSVMDRTVRLKGNRVYRVPYERMKQYQSNGFLQNIIEQPAEDATREWIDITTNRDDDLKVNRMIEKRMDELKLQKKLSDFIKFSRMYEKGSMLYYGVIADKPQDANELKNPMPLDTLQKIDFINVIEEPDRFYFFILNRYDPTKRDYNKVDFYIMGQQVHTSRLSWLVYNWYPLELMGVSIIETVENAVGAQDSALWSAASLMQDIATTVFKSDMFAGLSQDKIADILWSLKNQKNTQSVIGLKPTEEYQKLTYTLTGIKEIFDFVIECLGGVARMPRSILMGKAHGIITAQEYDALSYFNQIAKFQEIELRQIIKKIGDMIIHEQRGEIYNALGGGVDALDWDFTFKPLYKLDPKLESDKQLNDANRDKIDIEAGKMSPQEARTLDPRMDELEDFTSPAARQQAIQTFAPVKTTKQAAQPSSDNLRNITVDPVHQSTDMQTRLEKEAAQGIKKPEVKSNFGFRTISDKIEPGDTI